MFSNTNTGLKLHLLLIIIIAGVAYFMYQLYNECKDLERELVIAKRQIARLTTQKEGDCLATLVCPLGPSCKEHLKVDGKNESDEEEIDIDDDVDDQVSVKSDYINMVMVNVQQAYKEESDTQPTDALKKEPKESVESKEVVESKESKEVVVSKESKEPKEVVETEEPQESIEAEISEESEDSEESDESEDLSKLSKADLNKLKLLDLKDYLKARKQSTAGTKGELIARINALA